MKTCEPVWIAAAKRLGKDESGQDLIEYALLGALIGLAAVASIQVVANNLKAVFTAIPARAEAAMFG